MIQQHPIPSIPDCPACNFPMRLTAEAYRNWAWPTFVAFNDLPLAVCDNCGMGIVASELPDTTLHAFYGTAFRAMHSHVYLNLNRAPTNQLSHRAVAQVSLASAYCSFKPGDTFLDVGAGEGTSFFAARALLPAPQLAAIELTEGAEKYYGQNVGAAVFPSLDDFVAAGRHAKIVMLSHSLEHYRPSDIEQMFRGVESALAPDGALLVEVPHVDLKEHPERRPGDSPHLLFFTLQSLTLLLQRHGFEVLFIRTCGDMENVPTDPDIEDGGRRARRWLGNAVRNMVPVFVLRMMKAALLAMRPGRAFSGVAAAAYGPGRDCLRAVARKKSAHI